MKCINDAGKAKMESKHLAGKAKTGDSGYPGKGYTQKGKTNIVRRQGSGLTVRLHHDGHRRQCRNPGRHSG